MGKVSISARKRTRVPTARSPVQDRSQVKRGLKSRSARSNAGSVRETTASKLARGKERRLIQSGNQGRRRP
ncbi:hypothetical protein AUC71_02235 [Methyloceanibacter marginalis]|uniref:Uncharacterized protein n=1 Tax=Methyloceanibacter marginalis TaxID=1774971 RepID=A0A1E3W9B6_9HYPH|nr:hypothetical protein AUC71_02235 [Methyloceanibacter marginalis]